MLYIKDTYSLIFFNMEELKKAVSDVYWTFVLDAVLAIVAGVLILVYPDLLGIIVGAFLIAVGIKALIIAYKMKKSIKL